MGHGFFPLEPPTLLMNSRFVQIAPGFAHALEPELPQRACLYKYTSTFGVTSHEMNTDGHDGQMCRSKLSVESAPGCADETRI